MKTNMDVNELFPKAPDKHKPGEPMVPNGLGVIYVLISAAYLFFLYNFEPIGSAALTLASCILFGGFMGLLDDWADLRWRYKALLPLIAALPLAILREGDSKMATYFWGKIDFGIYYYIVIVPLIVAITTNAVNQLGGLNGLETVCPSIVLTGFFTISVILDRKEQTLLYVPLIVLWALAYFNFRGKIFVGNTGSFAAGITLAAYAIIANMEQALAISIIPYIINSSLILINALFFNRRASLEMNGSLLKSSQRRSLVTLIAYYYPSTERRLVLIISLIFILTTVVAIFASIA
ncbi:hypothetical protein DRO54_02115 [Candidatus Bathyarchaeota archaeon]|nr:MAG: hypothetical protein DRO54_02115 [Candidatus Bathyarchaeota archaeon]